MFSGEYVSMEKNDCNPLISIIVPIYNSEKYLGDCIDSILKQTYENIQLCLVNDGSVDASLSICRDFEKKDVRIIVIDQKNSGVSVARNCGIKFATGDYITFIDSDDMIEKKFIQELVSELNCSGSDVAFSGYTLLFGEKKVNKSARIESGQYKFEDLQDKLIDDGTLSGMLFGSVWGALYKRQIILDYDVRFKDTIRLNEDGLFNLTYLKHANSISVLSSTGYLYRQYTKSKSSIRNIPFDNELDKASSAIANECSSFNGFVIQMQRRELSVAFWQAIRCRQVDNTVLSIVRDMKSEFGDKKLADNYKMLDFKRISKAKHILVNWLAHGKYYWFVIAMRYCVPMMEKKVKH